MTELLQTYETDQPWVVYTYLHSDWWTRIFGRSQILCECCICGVRETVTIRIPRFGAIPKLEPHPKRTAFLGQHVHPLNNTAPETWAKPLRNPAALKGNDFMDILTDVAVKAQQQSETAEE